MAGEPWATVVFGSCSKPDSYPSQPVWTAIAGEKPTHLVLLGDQMYMDFGGTLYDPARWPIEKFRAEMYRRYSLQWDVREFQAFLRGLKLSPKAILATWDDHDFAWNNSVGGKVGAVARKPYFVDLDHRRISETLARQYLEALRTRPDKYPPIPEAFPPPTGLYSRGRIDNVPIFVLDTRSFLDHESGGDACLGETQEAWFESEIASIPVNQPVIIASGFTVAGGKPLDRKPSSWERWYKRNIAEEETWRARPSSIEFLSRVLRERKVLCLSGDIHTNAFASHRLPGARWPLHEAVSSGLAITGLKWGWLGKQQNYGVLRLYDDRWEIALHRNTSGERREIVIKLAGWEAG